MKKEFSATFLQMTVLFVVCLIASNLFATKVFALGKITLPASVIIFPISYILNDCFTEVWGYRKTRLVMWIAFAMCFFVVITGQLAVILPAASFWEGGDHFNYMFSMAPRVAIASLLAFLAGSNMNALVMSKMKVASKGKGFGWRAIMSSVAGEFLDSLIFLPIAFWGTPFSILSKMMLAQVSVKVLYEIIILPLTTMFTKYIKKKEGVDEFDYEISYNPFKIRDI